MALIDQESIKDELLNTRFNSFCLDALKHPDGAQFNLLDQSQLTEMYNKKRLKKQNSILKKEKQKHKSKDEIESSQQQQTLYVLRDVKTNSINQSQLSPMSQSILDKLKKSQNSGSGGFISPTIQNINLMNSDLPPPPIIHNSNISSPVALLSKSQIKSHSKMFYLPQGTGKELTNKEKQEKQEIISKFFPPISKKDMMAQKMQLSQKINKVEDEIKRRQQKSSIFKNSDESRVDLTEMEENLDRASNLVSTLLKFPAPLIKINKLKKIMNEGSRNQSMTQIQQAEDGKQYSQIQSPNSEAKDGSKKSKKQDKLEEHMNKIFKVVLNDQFEEGSQNYFVNTFKIPTSGITKVKMKKKKKIKNQLVQKHYMSHSVGTSDNEQLPQHQQQLAQYYDSVQSKEYQIPLGVSLDQISRNKEFYSHPRVNSNGLAIIMKEQDYRSKSTVNQKTNLRSKYYSDAQASPRENQTFNNQISINGSSQANFLINKSVTDQNQLSKRKSRPQFFNHLNFEEVQTQQASQQNPKHYMKPLQKQLNKQPESLLELIKNHQKQRNITYKQLNVKELKFEPLSKKKLMGGFSPGFVLHDTIIQRQGLTSNHKYNPSQQIQIVCI